MAGEGPREKIGMPAWGGGEGRKRKQGDDAWRVRMGRTFFEGWGGKRNGARGKETQTQPQLSFRVFEGIGRGGRDFQEKGKKARRPHRGVARRNV